MFVMTIKFLHIVIILSPLAKECKFTLTHFGCLLELSGRFAGINRSVDILGYRLGILPLGAFVR